MKYLPRANGHNKLFKDKPKILPVSINTVMINRSSNSPHNGDLISIVRAYNFMLTCCCWSTVCHTFQREEDRRLHLSFTMTTLLRRSKFVFRLQIGSKSFVKKFASNCQEENVVESSCKDVEIQQIPLAKFIWEKSTKLHGSKIALVRSGGNPKK